jgi:hypothetical protein
MVLQLDQTPEKLNAACPYLGKLPMFYSESYPNTNAGEVCGKATV